MSKKVLPHLVREFLKSSPRSRALKWNQHMADQQKINIEKLPSDEIFVRNFITHIDCTYMYQYYGPINMLEPNMKNRLRAMNLNRATDGSRLKQNKIEINNPELDAKTVLFELIKKLNKDSQSLLKYMEVQEYITKMSKKQIIQNKKLIVYIYKWVLNEKHSNTISTAEEQFCHETADLIIKCLYAAHEGDRSTEAGDLFKKTEEQILSIQKLQRARQARKNGDLGLANNIYAELYTNKELDQKEKKEAIDFVCERAVEEKSASHLKGMLKTAKSSRFREDEIDIEKTLRLINVPETVNQTPGGSHPRIKQEIPISKNKVPNNQNLDKNE